MSERNEECQLRGELGLLCASKGRDQTKRGGTRYAGAVATLCITSTLCADGVADADDEAMWRPWRWRELPVASGGGLLLWLYLLLDWQLLAVAVSQLSCCCCCAAG